MPNINKFYGGISNNRYIKGEAQYQTSNGIDCRSKLRYVVLNREPQEVYTIAGQKVTAIYRENGKLIVGTESGKVYYDGVEKANTGGKIYTITFFSGAVIFAGLFDTKFITIWNIINNNWILTDMTGALYGGYTVNYLDNVAYTAIDGEIRKITNPSFGNYTIELLPDGRGSFRGGSAGLSIHSDNIYAYTTRGDVAVVSVSTDGDSEKIKGVKIMGEDMNYAFPYGYNDVMILGTSTDTISYINGGVGEQSHGVLTNTIFENINKTLLGEGNKFLLTGGDSVGGNGVSSTYRGTVYTIGKGGYGNAIYSYGNKHKNFNQAWSIDYSTTDTIGGLYIEDGILYFSKNGTSGATIYSMDLNEKENTKYISEGIIILNSDDGGDLSIKKNLSGPVVIGCKIPTNTSIEVGYSLDDKTYVKYYEFTPSDIIGGRGIKTLPIGDFYQIDWVIKLKTTDDSKTPELYNFSYNLKATN